jgi:hypothetical protein
MTLRVKPGLLKIGPVTIQWAQHFWDGVKIGGPDECWLWTRSPCTSGYGIVSLFGRRSNGHKSASPRRIAYYLFTGQEPGLKQIHQTCGNRLCCNPKHLRRLSRDEASKLLAKQGVFKSNKKRRGSKQHNAKLTEADIPIIRALFKEGKYASEIAKTYKVATVTLYRIKNGKIWTHVP